MTQRIYTPALTDAIGEARDAAWQRATLAADTVWGVRAGDMVSEGIVESALAALEEARDELLRVQVMDEHREVVEPLEKH